MDATIKQQLNYCRGVILDEATCDEIVDGVLDTETAQSVLDELKDCSELSDLFCYVSTLVATDAELQKTADRTAWEDLEDWEREDPMTKWVYGKGRMPKSILPPTWQP